MKRKRQKTAHHGARSASPEEVVVPVTTLQAILSVMENSVRGFRLYGDYLLNVITELERTHALPADQLSAFRRDVESTQGVFLQVELSGAPLLESLKVLTAARGSSGESERVM